MSLAVQQQEVLGLLDALDASLADMLPRPGDAAAGARATEAVKRFASTVGRLEGFLEQLKEVPTGGAAAPGEMQQLQREVKELQTELQEKDRLIARARDQVARWQDVIHQQEQLQEETLFAGLTTS